MGILLDAIYVCGLAATSPVWLYRKTAPAAPTLFEMSETGGEQ